MIPRLTGAPHFVAVLLMCLAALAPMLRATGDRPRELLTASVAFADKYYDDRAALLWSPAAGDHTPGRSRVHRVRESTWYALGLMQRNEPGDRARAIRIIEAVLPQQITAPGERFDGTFHRAPEELHPPANPVPFRDYDPNWRQFIGCTFALFLLHYEKELPPTLPERLVDSIRRAVEGELQAQRLQPAYTNIALMHGFLWAFAGQRLGRPEWISGAEEWVRSVRQLHDQHGAFDEFNSPTYYGVDLFGLALLREHGATPALRRTGAELEAGLWRETARFYHAGLRNLAGPYDRAYGMDLRQHVSLLGVWMSLALPRELSPLPDPSGPMEHAHDFVCTPTYVILGARIPEEALAEFRTFSGERTVTRRITDQRVATAWLAERIMIGGEITSLSRAAGNPDNQFHPATIHWLTPGGAVGWILLREVPRVDARAEENRLSIQAVGDASFRISVPGLVPEKLSRNRWALPGLEIAIETDARDFTVSANAGVIEVKYREATHYVLTTRLPDSKP